MKAGNNAKISAALVTDEDEILTPKGHTSAMGKMRPLPDEDDRFVSEGWSHLHWVHA